MIQQTFEALLQYTILRLTLCLLREVCLVLAAIYLRMNALVEKNTLVAKRYKVSSHEAVLVVP